MQQIDGETWFCEKSKFWPGQFFALKVDEVLFQGKSAYQDILVFKSGDYGNVLVLDNAVQLTQKDEFVYHEMMAFLPLNVHPSPKKVLIVGGGDGGIARECAKHPLVESVTVCEIDDEVVQLSKRFLPYTACAFDDPKVHLHIGDGFEFLKSKKGEYDVIITDSSDPVGPGEALFQHEYYELLRSALNGPSGIVCALGECIWLHLDLIASVQKFSRKLFPSCTFAVCGTPTYPSGSMGIQLCSLESNVDFATPRYRFTEDQRSALRLRFYNEKVHQAAFALPEFVVKKLQDL